FPVTLDRREIRRRQAAEGGRGGLSLYGAERVRMHADSGVRRARAVWATGAKAGKGKGGGAGGWVFDADRGGRGDLDGHTGGGDRRAGRGGYHRCSEAVARGS